MLDSRASAIRAELERILNAPEFKNSNVLQRFLTFVVTETIEGRESTLKSVVVAQAVFDRGPSDDGADNAVRTTAVRLRTALNSLNARAREDRKVVIRLPKGGYIPTFEVLEPGASYVPSSGNWWKGVPFRWIATAAAGLLMLVLIVPLLLRAAAPPSREPVIVVQPPQALGRQSTDLAGQIERRLAPHMASIGLGQVVDAGQDTVDSTGGGWPLFLRTLADAGNHEIAWNLIDTDGVIRWTGREQIDADRSDGVFRAISRVAFRIIGENGAVPLLAERHSGGTFLGVNCVTRAQLLLPVETHDYFNEIRSCLTDHLEVNPTDATAWAILSATQAVRSRYETAKAQPGYANLIPQAIKAAERARILAPNAYLTYVAQMHIALSRRDIETFLTVQEHLREEFPGDLYLHLRIASRLARLGYGTDALEIYREATRHGINLSGRGAELALAYLVEGDVENALVHIMSSHSTQQYVLVLKAAILGLVGRPEDARLYVDQLVQKSPRIREEFYPWHSQLLWNRDLLETLEHGLGVAGLHVVPLADDAFRQPISEPG